jgi:hypothetical protein
MQLIEGSRGQAKWVTAREKALQVFRLRRELAIFRSQFDEREDRKVTNG